LKIFANKRLITTFRQRFNLTYAMSNSFCKNCV